MFEKLAEVGRVFRLEGELCAVDTIQRGNINTTYKITFRMMDGRLKSYVAQKINTFVFKKPEEIMSNIDQVTTHIQQRYPQELSLHFHHTAGGKNYLCDADGSFWRIMNYVDSVTFDTCEDQAIIAATGEAFGRFQMQLADFDGKRLYETIPDFHNTRRRLDRLFQDAALDRSGRLAECQDELRYLASVRQEAGRLSERYEKGEFPVRVTHNDTKSNNVLFDRLTLRPILVVDLDTVMPGMSVYDFGDAVRFICNTAGEDEPDLRKVAFDSGKFRAFCRGYLGQVRDILTPVELDNLVNGAFSVTVELASRFLDDYLTGDQYFKIDYPRHNLVRTRCQLALAKDIQYRKAELERIAAEALQTL